VATGTKSFCIDHPADPENTYLYHYCIESSEVLNSYSGTIKLDGSGGATVDLPSYFAAINKDPRYTLTAMGAPMPMLHISTEINDAALAGGERVGKGEVPRCWFRIGGGTPWGKASWRVEAVRNDRWVQAHGAPVEVAKPAGERGTYLRPELYGKPPEAGRFYRQWQPPVTPSTPSDH